MNVGLLNSHLLGERPESDEDRLAGLERCLAAIDTASIEETKAILKHLLEDRIFEYRHRLGE